MGGDCSAEGGTREGRVKGTLGLIGFIARLAPMPPYCALSPVPWSPSTAPSSPAAPFVLWLGPKGVASYYAYEYAYVPCKHGGVFGPSGSLPGLLGSALWKPKLLEGISPQRGGTSRRSLRGLGWL